MKIKKKQFEDDIYIQIYKKSITSYYIIQMK